MPLDTKVLLQRLVSSELITPEQATAVQAKADAEQVPLEQVLIDDEYISDENLGQVVADQYGVPFIALSQKSIDNAVLKLVPELVAKRQRVVAFERSEREVRVAMADPGNEELADFIGKAAGVRVVPYCATPRDINQALGHYRRGLAAEFSDIILQNVTDAQRRAAAERELPIMRIVDTILEYAYTSKASDVHLEPHQRRVTIRFRIDGVLHDVATLPPTLMPFLVTRIKVLSKLRTDEHRAAQDGRLEFTAEDGTVDVRVSIVPISDGEKIVMRLLAEKSRQFKLAELGLEEEDLHRVEKCFRRPYGMILATGPTGSGKTTTLYAILKILNTREVNIATIEYPVEYNVDGVNQIQVNTKTNLTFASGLRSILRQDPDIVMVGEIRDEETAAIAINAAMTGHLVLSTLHANDAPTTLPRLLDMKVEPFLIASTVNVAVAQRLVRTIHRACLESYQPDAASLERWRAALGEERWQRFKLGQPNLRLYRGTGCKLCSGTGYEGRIGIFEVLEVTEGVRQCIMRRASSDELRKVAQAQGMTIMLDDGIRKVLRGVTTIEEVMRASQE
ncbi:MAG: ATPase, T2SS/T4P/T4SS family [Patescibacteria group bacterium]